MSKELLPCPFCGAAIEAKAGGLFHPESGVELDCALAGMSWRSDYYSAAWNTRATDHHPTAKDWRNRCERAEAEATELREENARLREAGQAVIDTAFDHYTARNGRRMSIEGDDGEKCWIVPFDHFEALRKALENRDDDY